MNSIITLAGRKKMAEARAGIRAVAPIVAMAVGDGGIDENGKVKIPGDTLNHELLRREVESITKVSDTCYCYRLCIKEDELIGCELSEKALIDSDGDIVAILNFARKEKDEGAKMYFELEDIF